MKRQSTLITIWALLIIVMILHFNYHIGEIFYGIDIELKDASGTVPIRTHVIRNIFYHLPIIWILTLVYFSSKAFKLTLFLVSLVYTFAHTMHLVKDMADANFSQTPLLTLALLLSIILNIEQFLYWKKGE